MRLWRGLAFFWVAVLPAAPPGPVAIRNARLVAVSGPELARGTVLVRDGLIEAVGAEIEIPKDAWVIEGEGLTVYPGLIDALSTWGLAEGAAGPAASGRSPGRASPAAPATPAPSEEERGPPNSHIRAADLIRPSDRRLEEAREAGFTTAVTFPARGVFGGQGAVINLAGEKAGAMVVAAPAAQYISFSNLGFGSFPSSLMGAMAHVRQVYLDAGRYRLARDRYARNPNGARRPEYDRALEGLLETRRALLPASRAVEIERALKLAAELGNQEVVLYGLHEGYRAIERLRAAGKPVLVSLKWPERSREADPEQVDSLRLLELREKAPSTPPALARAGIRFAFYSDGTERARDLLRAVKRSLDAGLSREDAFRALTLSAAEIYGVADRLGSLDKGKIANLVVATGDPWDEKARLRCVFIDGVKYEPLPESGQEGARP